VALGGRAAGGLCGAVYVAVYGSPARAGTASAPRPARPPAGHRRRRPTPGPGHPSPSDGYRSGLRPTVTSPRSGEGALHRCHDLRRLRLGLRREPGEHLAVPADQELLEVPADVAAVALGIGEADQPLVQEVPSLPVDL